MKLKIFFSIIFTLILNLYKVVIAVDYLLPTNGSRLIGKNKTITIPQNNIKPLEYFAAKYQLGLSNMLEANPNIDPFLPKGGTILNIPQQLILPDTIHKGIIINVAEMRLYYYPNHKNIVTILPIGIGQIGKDTPKNWVTKIISKKANPQWIPTAKIRAEYMNCGELLPRLIPAGPNNPMGPYALYIGNMYAIHGTNTNFGIGLRISHGCIRLRNNDIKFLFKNVPIGTRVQFINDPVKITIEPNRNCYLEVHNPLSSNENQIINNITIPIVLKSKINNIIKKTDINLAIVNQAIQNRSGIPVKINK